ncbi:Down syndrome cell adhesion molecule homolog isoform X2 [Patiria miniata]|uniref:Down syndrome cell adhesion molecule-like protein Dscam2 n=1 Tax=Patiria miniata TaxID=46514 RepID=A0A914AP12_PATMI|nr:Down syndrome cell adhesion molecule homolog isoform X2 [Patiria miniata]
MESRSSDYALPLPRTVAVRMGVCRACARLVLAAALLLGLVCLPVAGDSSQLIGPQFVAVPPPRVDFAHNGGAQLVCSAYGEPAPTIQWVLAADDSPVEEVAGLRLVTENGTLIFPPFAPEDYVSAVHEATYRCIARNRVGAIRSPNIQVNAVIIQAYTVELHDNHVMRGNTAVFKCALPAYVKDYVDVTSWSRSTNPLTSDGRFSILPTGELHIRDVRDEDGTGYQYRCSTKNRLTGAVKVSRAARLNVANPTNTVPEMINSRREYVGEVGDAVELPCVASGYPIPAYHWKKDGEPVTLDDRLTLNGGNLLITIVELDDDGVYECEATSDSGSVTASRHLTIREPLAVYFYPQRRSVDVGAFANFNCTVSGYPIERVTWYKNARPLDGDDRVTIFDNGTLEVSDMTREDRGMYQCVASNSWETKEATMQLSMGAAKPILLDHFTNETLQPGPNLQLSCTVAGNPAPDVTWYRDDAPIPPISRYAYNVVINADGDVVSYLNITGLRPIDGGLYRCEATSEIGVASHEDSIFVIGPPYVRPLPNITAVADRDLTVHCRVVGYPIQSITWSKRGLTLPTNIRQTVFPNGTLVIGSVEQGRDEGEYVCTARNKQQMAHSQKFTLAVHIPPEIAPFSTPPLPQGQRTQLLCTIPRGDVPITISWLKDGGPIPPGIGITQSQTAFSSSLLILDASPVHDGNYTCVASNMVATVNYTTELVVLVPPRFVLQPEDTSVVLNHTVYIPCVSDGKPKPVVMWKKAAGPGASNFVDLPEDPRIWVTENGSMVIEEVEEEDGGFYLCHISNDVGSDSKTAKLSVYLPARFENHAENITLDAGQDVHMDCLATGHDPLEIQWRKDGALYTRLELAGKFEIQTIVARNALRSVLSLFSVAREDTAVYTCHAENAYGTDERTIRLWVLEPPEPPSNLSTLAITSRSATFGWRPEFDGNSPLTGFTLEYKNGSDAWQGGLPTAHVPTNVTRFQWTIAKLHPYNTYHVRIYAFNAIGISEASREILFTTDEEVPSGPPLNIEFESHTSQSITITWRQPRADLQNGVLLGYQIRYKDRDSPFQTISIPVETGYIESYTLKHLRKFGEYTIQLAGYNRKGMGPWSPERNIFTLEDVPSEPPRTVNAIPTGPTSIIVMWDSPASEDSLNGILQGYRIYYEPVREDEDETDTQVYETLDLTAHIYNLQKFTNYSVEVVAYTRVGEGVRSPIKYVRTQEDLPGAPADIKAYAASPTSVMVAWLPPLSINGILLHYYLNVKFMEGENEVTRELELDPDVHHYMVNDLETNHEYDFWVRGKTVIGKGESSRVATEIPMTRVPARVMSFSKMITTTWKDDVTMDCLAVGEPTPTIEWKRNRSVLEQNERMQVLSNGSLTIRNVQPSNAGNYSCRASNMWGAPDEITVALYVVAPPYAPILSVGARTANSIEINWRSGGNGGSPILAYQLNFKREHEQSWTRVNINSTLRSYRVTDVLCGTPYTFFMTAENKLGVGKPSEEREVRTTGEIPIPPSTDKIAPYSNATSITLVLSSWGTGGCPIRSYSIQYQHFGDENWVPVSSNIPPSTARYMVEELHPVSWYVFRVTAVNGAGPSVYEFRIATTAYGGGTAAPIDVKVDQSTDDNQLLFYENPLLFGPVLGGITLLLIILFIGLFVFSSRKHRKAVLKKAAVKEAETTRLENNNFPTNGRRYFRTMEGALASEQEPFLNGGVAPINNLSSITGATPWVFNSNSDFDVEVLEGAVGGDPYLTYNPDDSSDVLFPSMSTFRSTGSDDVSLGDLGPHGGAAAGGDRLYDLPPDSEYIVAPGNRASMSSSHDYACLDDIRPHMVPAVPNRPQNVYCGTPAGTTRQTPPHTPGGASHGRRRVTSKRGSQASICTTASVSEELASAYENAIQIERARRRRPPSVTSPSALSHPENYDYSTASDIEAGIRHFTASPPLPSVPERSDSYIPHRTVSYVKEGARPREYNRRVSTTSPHPSETSESEQDRGRFHAQVYRPSRYKANRRGRKGYMASRPVIRASRGPARRQRQFDSRSSTPSSSSPDFSGSRRQIGVRHDPSSPSEGYISLPYDSFSAAPSGVTDSDTEPRWKGYHYRRKPREKGSMSEPERWFAKKPPLPPAHRQSATPIPKVIHPDTKYHVPNYSIVNKDRTIYAEQRWGSREQPRWKEDVINAGDCNPQVGSDDPHLGQETNSDKSSFPSCSPPPPPPPPMRRHSPDGNDHCTEEIEIHVLSSTTSTDSPSNYRDEFTIV